MSRGPLEVNDAPEAYAESRLLGAAAALQNTALILGSPHIRHWFDEGLLARAQGDMLQIQVQMLEKLQSLNTRALEDLHARQGHGEGGGAAAEYLAREGQQACGSRVAALSEVIANRHTTKLHAGDEVREDFNCLPERIEFRADSEPLVSVNVSVAQSDFKRVLLALQSLLDVVESGSKGGACGHGCHSSSSVRCGCRTRSCGVVGTSHLTGEESPVGGDFEEEL